jgi:hypothetical protein
MSGVCEKDFSRGGGRIRPLVSQHPFQPPRLLVHQRDRLGIVLMRRPHAPLSALLQPLPTRAHQADVSLTLLLRSSMRSLSRAGRGGGLDPDAMLVVLGGGLIFREQCSSRFWGEVSAAADGGLASVATPVDADGGSDADVEGLREAHHRNGEVPIAQLAHGNADACGLIAEDKLRRTG